MLSRIFLELNTSLSLRKGEFKASSIAFFTLPSPFTVTCTHDSHTAIFQYGLHIIEVEVDETMYGNDFQRYSWQLRSRCRQLCQGIENKVWINLAETFIVDYQ